MWIARLTPVICFADCVDHGPGERRMASIALSCRGGCNVGEQDRYSCSEQDASNPACPDQDL